MSRLHLWNNVFALVPPASTPAFLQPLSELESHLRQGNQPPQLNEYMCGRATRWHYEPKDEATRIETMTIPVRAGRLFTCARTTFIAGVKQSHVVRPPAG